MKTIMLSVLIGLFTISEAAMQNIPYNDNRLHYSGRWLIDGGAKTSAWQSSQLRFKVSGTTEVTLNLYAVDPDSTYQCGAAVCIDGGDIVRYWFTGTTEIFAGNKTVTIPLSTGTHDLTIKFGANYPYPTDSYGSMFKRTAKIKLLSLDIDDGAVLSAPPALTHRIMTIGDSWMSAWLGWPDYMSPSFDIYPIAYGGAKASDVNRDYPYDAFGLPKAGDPSCGSVIISYGVNDYNAGVSVFSYQASLQSLVDKVRADQPTAKIYLLQTPRNIRDGRNYDQYGTAMAAIAAARANVVYLSSADVWGSLEWATGDPGHLSYAGRLALAAWVAPQIIPQQPVVPDGSGGLVLVRNGETLPGSLVLVRNTEQLSATLVRVP